MSSIAFMFQQLGSLPKKPSRPKGSEVLRMLNGFSGEVSLHDFITYRSRTQARKLLNQAVEMGLAEYKGLEMTNGKPVNKWGIK